MPVAAAIEFRPFLMAAGWPRLDGTKGWPRQQWRAENRLGGAMGGKNSGLKHGSGLCKMDRFLFRNNMKLLAELRDRRRGIGARGRAEKSGGGEGAGKESAGEAETPSN